MIHADELLIVRNDLCRATGIRQKVQFNLATKQTTILVHGVRPELIALLSSLTVSGEIARERDRNTDFDGRLRLVSGGPPAASTKHEKHYSNQRSNAVEMSLLPRCNAAYHDSCPPFVWGINPRATLGVAPTMGTVVALRPL